MVSHSAGATSLHINYILIHGVHNSLLYALKRHIGNRLLLRHIKQGDMNLIWYYTEMVMLGTHKRLGGIRDT